MKLDGVDLLPYLTGEIKTPPHETLYWRFGEQWAIRKGDYKLTVNKIDGKEMRLFNLADDIGETKDLKASHPQVLQDLRSTYEAWNKEQADPLWRPNPAKEEKKKKKMAK